MTRSSATQQPGKCNYPKAFSWSDSPLSNGAVILPWVQVPNVPVIADIALDNRPVLSPVPFHICQLKV